MDAERTPEQSQALLARETRLAEGHVATELGGIAVPPGQHLLVGDAFLLHAEDGARFLYRHGAGVTVDRGTGGLRAEEELWLNGSVYAAVACLNGFLPLHASAVAHDGEVIAFTGPAGAGKSTLAAGLGRLGLPLFCDDTMLIDLSARSRPYCMPGHKRLKLRDDALALTGATAQAPVGAGTGKSYARPLAGDVATPLPLGRLVYLTDGPEFAWEPVSGAQRMARLDQAADHHTRDLFVAATRPTHADLFAIWAWLARSVPMTQLTRPRVAASFPAVLAGVAEQINGERAQ